MYALIAFGKEPDSVRVITVGNSSIILKEWLSRPSMYWWNTVDNKLDNPPKLTWRFVLDHNYPKPTETQEAVFYGQLFGSPVTKLQIKQIEAYGT